MARILVRRGMFERGEFPPVCCKSGAHGDVYSAWEFSHMPRWTYVLILFGILPFLVASAFATVRLRGVLPISTPVQGRLKTARRWVWAFGIGAVVLGIVGMASSSPAALAPAAIALVAWLATVACVWVWSPNARLDADDVVELTNVHRGFVEAIRSAHQTAPPPVDV